MCVYNATESKNKMSSTRKRPISPPSRPTLRSDSYRKRLKLAAHGVPTITITTRFIPNPSPINDFVKNWSQTLRKVEARNFLIATQLLFLSKESSFYCSVVFCRLAQMLSNDPTVICIKKSDDINSSVEICNMTELTNIQQLVNSIRLVYDGDLLSSEHITHWFSIADDSPHPYNERMLQILMNSMDSIFDHFRSKSGTRVSMSPDSGIHKRLIQMAIKSSPPNMVFIPPCLIEHEFSPKPFELFRYLFDHLDTSIVTTIRYCLNLFHYDIASLRNDTTEAQQHTLVWMSALALNSLHLYDNVVNDIDTLLSFSKTFQLSVLDFRCHRQERLMAAVEVAMPSIDEILQNLSGRLSEPVVEIVSQLALTCIMTFHKSHQQGWSILRKVIRPHHNEPWRTVIQQQFLRHYFYILHNWSAVTPSIHMFRNTIQDVWNLVFGFESPTQTNLIRTELSSLDSVGLFETNRSVWQHVHDQFHFLFSTEVHEHVAKIYAKHPHDVMFGSPKATSYCRACCDLVPICKRCSMLVMANNTYRQPFHYHVDRDPTTIILSALEIVERFSSDRLNMINLHIVFTGEPGRGDGTVRDFIEILSKQLFSSTFGLWLPVEESDFGDMIMTPALESFVMPYQLIHIDRMKLFHLSGVVVALALCHNVPIQFSPPPFWLYEDYFTDHECLDQLDQSILKQLSLIKTMAPEVLQPSEMPFTLWNYILDPNHTVITPENRAQYCSKVPRFLIHELYQKEMQYFQQGFRSVINKSSLQLLSPKEFVQLLRGSTDFDLVKWQQQTKMDRDKSPVYQFFWDAVSSLNTEQRQHLFCFWTSRSVLPLEEFRGCKLVIRDNDTDQHYPRSHTCFMTLELPPYSSYEITLTRLLTVLSNKDVWNTFQTI